jgi:uncharacterized SAM-binding protein YcdF (DUF218 family)
MKYSLKMISGERKIKYWQAPMDPTEIYDHPGKSKMGMDLLPVYENQVAKGNLIKIDPTTEQNMGVRTITIKRKKFTRTLRTVGIIEYDEQNVYVVSSKISGWVEQLRVNATGQPVRKGQTLLKIYSPDLVTTQQEFLLALQNKQNTENSSLPELRQSADALLQASLKRLLYWDIPQSQIRQLEKSGKVQKLLMSGDNPSAFYDEPTAMMNYAIARGVPAEDIQPDFAGRRTYDTCYRAKAIFRLDSAVLVTQDFHLPRALFTCRVLGIDAVGVVADLQSYDVRSLAWSQGREILASAKALPDVILQKPAPVLGDSIPIN